MTPETIQRFKIIFRIVYLFVPIRVSSVIGCEVMGRPAIIRWSAWFYRGRSFGRRREWIRG